MTVRRRVIEQGTDSSRGEQRALVRSRNPTSSDRASASRSTVLPCAL